MPVKVMKQLLVFWMCFLTIKAQSQRFNDVIFTQLPQDLQLYPRNSANQGTVPISGRIESTDWHYIAVQIFRNGQLVAYRKATITYHQGIGYFSTTPTITAEKAEYRFKVFQCKSNDSTLLVTRNNVVSGDVLVLTGQSNATCFFNDTRTNEYCRTFGKITGTFNTEPYDAADTLWALSNQQSYTINVGILGFEIQQRISDTYNVPTCLINSGFNWSSAAQHANRNPNNPADLTNGYGRMIYRLTKAGVISQVKALIYRQGESEAYGEGYDFIGNFTRFYHYVKNDLVNLQKLYVFQIDIINYARPDIAPIVRDDQRKLGLNYPDIEVLPSIGTVGFDGLHYSPEGLAQNAYETFRLIAKDFYASTDTNNIKSPNIRKAYYSKLDKTEITLVFEAGQELLWQNEHRGQQMGNFFYLDGQSGHVASGRAVGRTVILQLNHPINATQISYLPAFVPESASYFPYSGPYLSNRKNMRAFSFYQVPIEAPPMCLQTNTCCLQNESLMSGNWHNSSIWSCNHVPTDTDEVIINHNHVITVNDENIHAKALSNQGTLILQNNTILKLK